MTLPTQATPAQALGTYHDWLARQPLSAHTRRTYLGRVRQYCAYLAATPTEYGDPLCQPHARDYAVRDYKREDQDSRVFVQEGVFIGDASRFCRRKSSRPHLNLATRHLL